MKDRISRPHWSYSSLSQFLRCPLQYYFERVLGMPRRTVSEAQVLGSSVHVALAVAPVLNSAGVYLERPLLVVPDLITRQEHDTPNVVEIKTSGRAFSDSEVATSLQPTAYGHAVHELSGKEPGLEYVVLVKTRTPKVQRVEAVRTNSDFGRLGDIIGAVERAIDAGSFFPVESPLNCSGCAYFRECRSWTGPGTSNSGELRVLQLEEATPCSRR
jgi:CRISPR/Cas system-associated exonuclease Cas4 (RecB family)